MLYKSKDHQQTPVISNIDPHRLVTIDFYILLTYSLSKSIFIWPFFCDEVYGMKVTQCHKSYGAHDWCAKWTISVEIEFSTKDVNLDVDLTLKHVSFHVIFYTTYPYVNYFYYLHINNFNVPHNLLIRTCYFPEKWPLEHVKPSDQLSVPCGRLGCMQERHFTWNGSL